MKTKDNAIPGRLNIRERAAKVPLETRLYVMFWMHYQKENNANTEKEGKIGSKWANKMTKETMETIAKWEKDGSPTYIKDKGSELPVKNNLKDIRVSQGKSQKTVAGVMKIDPTVVSKIEKNFKKAQVDTILRYAKALKATNVTLEFNFPKNEKHVLPLNLHKK